MKTLPNGAKDLFPPSFALLTRSGNRPAKSKHGLYAASAKAWTHQPRLIKTTPCPASRYSGNFAGTVSCVVIAILFLGSLRKRHVKSYSLKDQLYFYGSRSVPSTAGPPSLEVAFPFGSPRALIELGFAGCVFSGQVQRGLKKEVMAARKAGQADGNGALVNEILFRAANGMPVEGRRSGGAPSGRSTEAVQPPRPGSARVGRIRIVSAVSPSKSFARENDFERPTAAPTRCGEKTFRTANRRDAVPPPGLRVGPSRVFLARREKRMSQARTNSLLTPRTTASGSSADADLPGDLVRRP